MSLNDRFNTFNFELDRVLREDYPKSLVHAIIACAETFDVDIEDVVPLIGDNFKTELSEEFNIDLSGGFPDDLF
mgnify:CR=1 FL=1